MPSFAQWQYCSQWGLLLIESLHAVIIGVSFLSLSQLNYFWLSLGMITNTSVPFVIGRVDDWIFPNTNVNDLKLTLVVQRICSETLHLSHNLGCICCNYGDVTMCYATK